MLAEARNDAKMSLECAEAITDVPRRSISQYEICPEKAPPDRVLKLSKAYHNLEVLEWYCTDVCPIGREQHCKIVVNGLTSAVMTMITEMNDVENLEKQLMKLTCDGVIDLSEMKDMEKIMTEIEHVERAIHALKAQYSKELSRIQKERAAS